MDHSICINSLSTPAQSAEKAYYLLTDACLGMLELNTGNDRFIFYYDDEKNRCLEECRLAVNYTYKNFLNDLEDKNENDLLLFLIEAVDKSPALDHIINESEDIFDAISSCHFYLPGTGSDKDMDTLGIAWLLNATLLSLLTEKIWDTPHLEIAQLKYGDYSENLLLLNNIAKYEHGEELRQEWNRLAEQPLEEICPECRFSTPFLDWYNGLDDTNRYRVRDKLQSASDRSFQGGKPFFDTLDKADGIREIRFSAYPGGTTRVLFGALPDQKQAILIGFIKKSNREGYSKNIPRAKDQWEKIRENFYHDT
ncbi:type II toxin-antitoxin system RelE/ParE family toxin [Desulfococcaceae bacterium HSG8]|nr:type II toxin-antitoxin system RelE/ParE family toxin [Desulfococcaceae bacterium HSG8]